MIYDPPSFTEPADNRSYLESQIHDDPADAAVSDQLEMAYREQGRTDELLQLLLSRAENVVTVQERVDILAQAAEVCASTGDKNSALMILLTAFDQARDNVQIADALDHLAHETGEWEEVLDAYLIAAAQMEDEAHAGDLWLRIACAHAFVTGDTEQLSAALEHVHSVSEDWAQGYLDLVERQMHTAQLLGTLIEVCARIGDVPRHTRCLTRCIAMNDSVIAKAELHAQLASLHLSVSDMVAANFHLREALRLDPKRADCQAALIAVNKEEGNYREAAELLRSQALAADENRSEAAFEAAKLYSDLDENTQCFDLLSIAMQEDPHHLGAAVPLAERYFQAERWSELNPLLLLLLENRSTLPPSSPPVSELLYRAGYCALALKNTVRAKDLLMQARSLTPHHAPTLQALGEVLTELQDTDGAFLAYEQLLAVHEQGTGSPTERAATNLQMALIRRQQGHLDHARYHAEQAFLLDSSLDAAGMLLAEVFEEMEEYHEAIRVRHHLLKQVDVPAQIKLHGQNANLLSHKLGDHRGAIDEYERALSAQPDNRGIMNSLLEIYSVAEMWQDAVDVILQIADIEEAPLRRGKYYDAAGAILSRKLSDTSAIRCFNMALDCFFIDAGELPENLRAGCMRPFHRIVDFLHLLEDYEQLERNYRQMIHRLSKEDHEVVHLWQELGKIYKGKLNRPEDAIASYEVVSALDKNSDYQKVLLGLYEQSDEQLDKAIEQRTALVQGDPFEPEHYSALADIYFRLQQPDRAWCAVRVLVFLNKATEAQKSFYFQYRPTELRWPRVPVTAHMWQYLRHPGENPLVGNILALISDVMLADCAVDEGELHARDGNSPLHNELRGITSGVAYAMGMPSARVTVDLEVDADLLLLPTASGPAFVVGRGTWQARSMAARVHSTALVLACARPSAQLRQISESPQHLDAVLMAAMSFVRPDLSVPPAMAPQIASVHDMLTRRLDQPRRVRLAHAVQALVESGVRHDIAAWWQGVNCTSQRVALLLSGDLQVAVQLAHRTPSEAQEIVADLVIFSISPALLDMRRDLDIGVCAAEA